MASLNNISVNFGNSLSGTQNVIEVPAGTTSEQFIAEHFDGSLDNATATVRRGGQQVDTVQTGTNFVLAEGDLIVVSPRNVKGA